VVFGRLSTGKGREFPPKVLFSFDYFSFFYKETKKSNEEKERFRLEIIKTAAPRHRPTVINATETKKTE